MDNCKNLTFAVSSIIHSTDPNSNPKYFISEVTSSALMRASRKFAGEY
jgi:hypothetical protein